MAEEEIEREERAEGEAEEPPAAGAKGGAGTVEWHEVFKGVAEDDVPGA